MNIQYVQYTLFLWKTYSSLVLLSMMISFPSARWRTRGEMSAMTLFPTEQVVRYPPWHFLLLNTWWDIRHDTSSYWTRSEMSAMTLAPTEHVVGRPPWHLLLLNTWWDVSHDTFFYWTRGERAAMTLSSTEHVVRGQPSHFLSLKTWWDVRHDTFFYCTRGDMSAMTLAPTEHVHGEMSAMTLAPTEHVVRCPPWHLLLLNTWWEGCHYTFSNWEHCGRAAITISSFRLWNMVMLHELDPRSFRHVAVYIFHINREIDKKCITVLDYIYQSPKKGAKYGGMAFAYFFWGLWNNV